LPGFAVAAPDILHEQLSPAQRMRVKGNTVLRGNANDEYSAADARGFQRSFKRLELPRPRRKRRRRGRSSVFEYSLLDRNRAHLPRVGMKFVFCVCKPEIMLVENETFPRAIFLCNGKRKQTYGARPKTAMVSFFVYGPVQPRGRRRPWVQAGRLRRNSRSRGF